MLIHKRISLWLRARLRSHGPKAALAACALLVVMPLIAGCSRQGLAQAATATATASAPGLATVTPVTAATAAATNAPTTPEAGPSGTPGAPLTPRPIPTGAPPSDPITLFNVFQFFVTPEILVKRDRLQLDSDAEDEMLLTLSEPSGVVTQENHSALRVVDYDPKYREWGVVWQSDVVSGTASPLPAANRADGYNGGKLIGTNDPIFLLRANSIDGLAHLYIWRWDGSKNEGVRLKMVPAGGGAERDTDFEADLDVNVADLDGDGTYEVIADNTAGTQVWKWDGSRYAPEAKRP